MEMNGISGQASNKNGSLNNIMNQALRSLRLKLSAVRNAEVAKRPLILQLGKTADRKVLSALMRQRAVRQVSDDYPEQLRELFAIEHPKLVYQPDFEASFQDYLRSQSGKKDLMEQGNWVYYPWLSTLVHLLPERDFQRVRTARNRHLITEVEQKLYYDAVVGIAGLSVGNSVILAIVLQGGAKRIRLADFDRPALSNLNRIRAGVESLGLEKVLMTARQIYALNPYASLELYGEGLTEKNIKDFFSAKPKLTLLIDELDNIAMKYLIREHARKNHLPVIMGADNGDNVVVDIERYDLNSKTPFFHGRLGRVNYQMLKNLDKFGIGRTITRHIGPENVTERMQQSLLDMGRGIVSWPQLGGAALLNGSALAYCARKIATAQPVEKKRSLISLDAALDPQYTGNAAKRRRRRIVKDFKKLFGL